jgi:hypothetical protein
MTMKVKRTHKLVQRVIWLGVLVLLALAYAAWQMVRPQLPGTNRLEGILGVLLGLFICAQPAAHFIDIFFFRTLMRDLLPSDRSLTGWVVLNLFVLVVGWFVIFDGMVRMAAVR